MKKFSLFFIAMVFALAGFSQTTYYWVGGTGPVSFTLLTNFNTMLDGSGTPRITGSTNDILIFDGSNIGGSTPTTGTVTAQVSGTSNIAQFKLVNAATVVLQRAATGTGTINCNGDGTPAVDFSIPTGNAITVNNIVPAASTGSIVFNIAAAATGVVGGDVTIAGDGGCRLSPAAAGGLQFVSGSNFYANATPASTSAYPFGNSSTQSTTGGVVFKAGANLIVNGNKSPFAGTSIQPTVFMLSGSNYYQRAPRGDGSYVNSKSFGNFFVQAGSGGGTAFTADGTIYGIENLTIDNGSSFRTHSSGQTPITGNLVANGDLLPSVLPSTNTLVMGGNTAQTISGSGIINVPNFTVANGSDVTLQRNISVNFTTVGNNSTANIVGKISFASNSKIIGTADFTARTNDTADPITGNLPLGSTIINNVVPVGAGMISGNTGLKISGPGIQPGTNVLGFGTNNTIVYMYLSLPALSASTGGTFTFSSDSATLVSSNVNGFDNASGHVTVTGNYNYQSGTNYIINAATASPFGISTSMPSAMTVGNVSLNSAITTNYNIRVTGTLALNTGNLTVRNADTLRILTPTAIAGAPFSAAKHIVLATNGTSVGVVRYDNISTSTLFPVGSNANYLPVTVVPSSPMDFQVSVFEGATTDGTPSGAALTAGQKQTVVDAVYVVDRVTGTDPATITTAWDQSLEGPAFSTFADAEIGISHYDGAMYESAIGSGSQSLNTATATFSNFSPFLVTKVGTALPIKFLGITARLENNNALINWQVAKDDGTGKYEIEKSIDGRSFTSITTVRAASRSTYSSSDNLQAATGIIYYRIKGTDAQGKITYSNTAILKLDGNIDISLYPNPAINSLQLAGVQTNADIRIVNAEGKVFINKRVTAQSMGIDVSSLKPGWYMLQVIKDGKAVQQKTFTKQ